MSSSLLNLNITGLNGEKLSIQCPSDTLSGDLEKCLMEKYNYPSIVLAETHSPERPLHRNTPMSRVSTDLVLVQDRLQYSRRPRNEGYALPASKGLPKYFSNSVQDEKSSLEKIQKSNGETFAPRTGRTTESDERTSNSDYGPLGTPRFSQKRMPRRSPTSRSNSFLEKSEERPPPFYRTTQKEVSSLSSNLQEVRNSGRKRTPSINNDGLCITCRIPELGITHTVNMGIDSTVMGLVEKLRKSVEGIDSTINVMWNGRLLPLSDTKLFTLGIRGPCTVYIASGEFSNPETVTILEVEESLSKMQEKQKESLTDLEKNSYYEELMRLLLSLDGLHTLDGEWRQRKKSDVHQITLLQDLLKPNSM